MPHGCHTGVAMRRRRPLSGDSPVASLENESAHTHHPCQHFGWTPVPARCCGGRGKGFTSVPIRASSVKCRPQSSEPHPARVPQVQRVIHTSGGGRGEHARPGRPTRPTFRAVLNRPRAQGPTVSSTFFGGIFGGWSRVAAAGEGRERAKCIPDHPPPPPRRKKFWPTRLTGWQDRTPYDASLAGAGNQFPGSWSGISQSGGWYVLRYAHGRVCKV